MEGGGVEVNGQGLLIATEWATWDVTPTGRRSYNVPGWDAGVIRRAGGDMEEPADRLAGVGRQRGAEGRVADRDTGRGPLAHR